MHIADGILSTPVLIGGAAAATVGVGYGLWQMKPERVPQAAVLSSAFFVASLIHLPLPGGSVHLVLTGLMGVILGWSAVPAIFVGLLLQYLFLTHGGLTTLGVNVVCMAVPALVCHYLFAGHIRRAKPRRCFALGAGAGALGVALACVCMALCLLSSGDGFAVPALGIILYHLPIMLIEGAVTGAAVSFLRQVRPEALAPQSTMEVST